MRQKTQTARSGGKRDPEAELSDQVACIESKQPPSKSACERHTACHAINAIHHVIGVGETDDPQKSDDDAHNAELKFAKQRNGHCFEISQSENGYDWHKPLHTKSDS